MQMTNTEMRMIQIRIKYRYYRLVEILGALIDPLLDQVSYSITISLLEVVFVKAKEILCVVYNSSPHGNKYCE